MRECLPPILPHLPGCVRIERRNTGLSAETATTLTPIPDRPV